jgi:sec-independent protein translocase protein TatA
MNIFGLGTPEIILILVVILIFFGKDRLPDLAKSIGTSFRELKNSFSSSGKVEENKKDESGSKPQ